MLRARVAREIDFRHCTFHGPAREKMFLHTGRAASSSRTMPRLDSLPLTKARRSFGAILEKVVNAKGEGYGPEYGKEVHYDFADAVKEAIRLGDLRGDIRVEHTYPEGRDYRYGSKGTIGTDVVLRNDLGEVIVIYDVKTGGAELDVRRLAQLRAKTNANLSVPVVEMHVLRGLSLKGV